MLFRGFVERYLLAPIKKFIFQFIRMKPTKVRRESNVWIKHHAVDIKRSVLSIGSGKDEDSKGGHYRDYFKNCSRYITSEITDKFKCDIVFDVRYIPFKDKTIDCIFCSGVLEHVDDYSHAFKEITRVTNPGGFLLLGLPFRQAVHMVPNDYWRFTENGIRYMLKGSYEILDLTSMDNSTPNFPAAYWVKARKA